MARSLRRMTVLAGALGLVIICAVSCRKPVKPNELAIDKGTAAPPPNVANVIEIDPPVKAVSPTRAHTQGANEPIFPSHRLMRHWLMLLGVLLLLFLLSLMLFHTMGRRLGKRTFRAHAPTRHANIWASHKAPEFLDP